MKLQNKTPLFIKITIVSLLCVALFLSVFAHSGNTDSNGGHYNRQTGEYHFHHGEPEHQHSNGDCPYEILKTDIGDVLTKILLIVVGGFTALFFGPFVGALISLPFDTLKEHIIKRQCKAEIKEENLDHKSINWIGIITSLVLLILWICYVINL